MSASNYVYTSDAGVDYQVTVPDDFAIALGMTPASGTEPYLDRIISCRYAAYRSPLGLSRIAIIQTRAAMMALSSTLSVGGVTYMVTGQQGESIAYQLTDLYSLPMGPAGERGAAGSGGGGGSLTSYFEELTTQYTFSGTAGQPEVIFAHDLTAGTWLVMAQAIFYDSTCLSAAALTLATADYQAESYANGISAPSALCQHISGLFTLASGSNINLWAGAYGTAPVLLVGGLAPGQVNQKGTHIIFVKIA